MNIIVQMSSLGSRVLSRVRADSALYPLSDCAGFIFSRELKPAAHATLLSACTIGRTPAAVHSGSGIKSGSWGLMRFVYIEKQGVQFRSTMTRHQMISISSHRLETITMQADF